MILNRRRRPQTRPTLTDRRGPDRRAPPALRTGRSPPSRGHTRLTFASEELRMLTRGNPRTLLQETRIKGGRLTQASQSFPADPPNGNVELKDPRGRFCPPRVPEVIGEVCPTPYITQIGRYGVQIYIKYTVRRRVNVSVRVFVSLRGGTATPVLQLRESCFRL